MDEITLIFAITSTTITTLLAIIQLYIKIKNALKDAVKEIVDSELQNLKIQIEELKISQNELKTQIEEIKRKIYEKK